MASISMEGVVRPVGGCCNIIINNNSGGTNTDELNDFIKKFNSLDTNSVNVDSTTGIDIKVSNSEDNILEKTESGLYASLEWVDVQTNN